MPAHAGAARLGQEALAVLLQAARVLAVAALDVLASRHSSLKGTTINLGQTKEREACQCTSP